MIDVAELVRQYDGDYAAVANQISKRTWNKPEWPEWKRQRLYVLATKLCKERNTQPVNSGE